MSKIKDLLDLLLDDENQTKWVNGYNHAFNMSPKQMIDAGREEEVINYLYYSVYGPY